MVLRFQDPADHNNYEHMMITSIDGATTFSVQRGFSETTALAAIATANF